MNYPTLSEVKKDFERVIENMEFLIEILSTKNDLSFSEYLAQQGTIGIELIKLQSRINDLIAGDSIRNIKVTGGHKINKKYTRAFEGMRKTIIKMLVETGRVEKKHSKDIFFWE